MFNAWLAKCEKRFNVKINEKKWKATLAGEVLAGVRPEGNLYYIGATGGGSVYDMSVKGYITPLDDAMKKAGIDMTADHYSEFNTEINNINGKQWTIGVGFSRIRSTVLYNKKVTKAAGYDIAKLVKDKKWTWDKMTEIGKKTTVRNNSGEVTRWGIGIANAGIKALVLSNGGHFVHPDKNGKFVSQLNTENTREALQQVYEWYNVDKIATAFQGGQWTSGGEAFADKKITFLFGGHSETSKAYSKLSDEDYSVAYVPMGPRMKKYIAYMTWEYCYVIPAAYKDMAVELLLLVDELHELPEGYTLDDDFRDSWTRYFHGSEAYNIWKNHHFGDDVQRMWEGSDVVNLSGNTGKSINEIINGTVTPAAWIDANHNVYNTAAKDLAGTYTYTGKLK